MRGIVSQLAALGVEVPHQKQTGALLTARGKELAVLSRNRYFFSSRYRSKLLFRGTPSSLAVVRILVQSTGSTKASYTPLWGGASRNSGQLRFPGVFAARPRFRYSGTASGGVRLPAHPNRHQSRRAVLADGGNLLGDPALEGSRFRLFGTKDKMIESGFTWAFISIVLSAFWGG